MSQVPVRSHGEAPDGGGAPGIVPVGAIATASAASDVTEGDHVSLSATLAGRLRVISDATGTSSDQVQGNVAHDSADAGNPVGIGANAVTVPSATVTAGDRVRLVASTDGQLFVIAVGRTAIDTAVSGNPINAGVRCSTDAASQVSADSRVAMISADRLGRIRVLDPAGEAYAGSEGAWSVTSGVPGAASVAVKASAGRVAYVLAHQSNAAVRWLQIHNAAAALSGGETPVVSKPLAASNGANDPIDFQKIGGMRLGTGYVIAFSTTRDTYTAATASENFYTTLWK